ncbi:restriction endonuclease subunit S [Ureibacillus sp. 179-F W5.1 NHS]|uniref:restriction endonuclease subunit S n=1 Tax=Ureibacillus sp. 179-F W5.1 NHS TaxID=3374297 RepID=UPI003879BEFB
MVNRVLLKEITKITTGSSAPKEKYFSNNGLPFIRAGHLEALIESNKINELPKIDEETGKKLKLKKVGKGTILFAKSGMSSKKNRVYICTDNAYIVSHLAAIIPNSNLVNNSYLKYYLEWYKPSRLIIDESYPSIRTTDIGNIEINLPSLESQLRIVKILDQVRALIKKRKAQIEALDQLMQSVFLEMFGDPITNPQNWPIKKLGDNIEITGGFAFKSTEFVESGVPVIKIGTVNKGYFDLTTLTFVSKVIDKYEKYLVYPSDLLITLTGTVGKEDYGNVCIVPNDYEFYLLNQRVAKIKPLKNLNVKYLLYCFKQEKFKRRITKLSRGIRQANISNDDIKNLVIYRQTMRLTALSVF